jgi:hypothetical protein
LGRLVYARVPMLEAEQQFRKIIGTRHCVSRSGSLPL